MELLFDELYGSPSPICFPFAHTPFSAVTSPDVLLSEALQCCGRLHFISNVFTMSFTGQGVALLGYCTTKTLTIHN